MSKELEALKRVKYNSSKEVVDNFDIIEKHLQALEIIKKKNVDIVLLKMCACVGYYNHQIQTLPMYRGVGMKDLTQEEFDLLKEVLEDD